MTAYVEDAKDRLIVWNGNTDKRGAITPAFYQSIMDAVEGAKERRVRSVIITSQGGFFCAGGDLNALRERRSLPEVERQGKIELLHDVIRAIRNCPVPVIAAVKGGAAGAGASIALACDFIVMEAGAKFTAAYVKAGLVPDGGLTASLARMIPRPLAMEMCVLARPVTAERMFALGAVNAVVEVDQVMIEAHAFADAVAAGPRDAQASIRMMVAAGYDQTEAAQLDLERDAMAHAAGGDEAAEGIAAFLEKRKPEYGT
ncbi:MAG: 2-(1,2-epoxy-1,2-dihydrophenyl)acetyl-CoA isomerase [Gammaproteobacteria bacterium]|jgi:2-(1,2-epoxy-1,2-dihydrophenyl)acetyl-CoA isomerase|tara:strand:- start:9442 stop:10215 length:774 start_codon:yes stop_codon:yes gene_type:complete